MVITDENVEEVALRAYQNPFCLGKEDFNNDFKQFFYLNKYLCNRVNIQLVVNICITILNVFDNKTAFHLIMYHVNKDRWNKLKPLLMLFGIVPRNSVLHNIDADTEIVNKLKALLC